MYKEKIKNTTIKVLSSFQNIWKMKKLLNIYLVKKVINRRD